MPAKARPVTPRSPLSCPGWASAIRISRTSDRFAGYQLVQLPSDDLFLHSRGSPGSSARLSFLAALPISSRVARCSIPPIRGAAWWAAYARWASLRLAAERTMSRRDSQSPTVCRHVFRRGDLTPASRHAPAAVDSPGCHDSLARLTASSAFRPPRSRVTSTS
jgi:hypothetical protein